MPARFSRMAAIRLTRAESILSLYTRETAAFAGAVSACISTRKTRFPSKTAAQATPAG